MTRNVTQRAQAHPTDVAPDERTRQVRQHTNETAQATHNARQQKAEGRKQKAEDFEDRVKRGHSQGAGADKEKARRPATTDPE